MSSSLLAAMVNITEPAEFFGDDLPFREDEAPSPLPAPRRATPQVPRGSRNPAPGQVAHAARQRSVRQNSAVASHSASNGALGRQESCSKTPLGHPPRQRR